MAALKTNELAIIKREYPRGGWQACQSAGIKRSVDAIYSIAYRHDIPLLKGKLKWKGKSWSHAALARRYKINVSTLRKRLYHKRMPLAEALTTPIMQERSNAPR